MTDHAYGAYGFRIDGIDEARHLLNRVPDDSPRVAIFQEAGDAAPPKNTIGADEATIPFITGGGVIVRRDPPEAVVTVPERLTPEEIAHPYLAPIASVFAHWRGWIPFHAGGVVIDGVVWGIVGEREAGKSSLTAALAIRDLPIMADDVLVVDADGTAFAGPRTLDLREGAADHFGVGRDLGIVGLRERWRFDLGPAPLRAPLGGWIFPAWGDEISVELSSGGDRLRRLAPGRTVLTRDIDGGLLLRLIKVPSVTFTRPKEWAVVDEGLDALLAGVAEHAAVAS